MSSIKKIFAASTLVVMLIVFTGVIWSCGTGALTLSLSFPGSYQAYPFIAGGIPPAFGWDMSPWAFGSPCDVRSLPLYFNAHGWGFPFTLGNCRIGLIPSIY